MVRVRSGVAVLAGIVAASAPCAAQPLGQTPTAIALTPAERTALLPLKQAVDARNWTLAASLVPGARASVRSGDARYVVARLQLEIATATRNRAAQNEAISAVLETRKPGPQEQVELLRQYAGLAYDAGGLNAAEGALNRALQMAPDDAEALSMLAQIHRTRNNTTQALAFFQRAMRAAASSGRALPESRYKSALALAEQSGQRGVALEMARHFIAAYPTPMNWRDVILVFRTVGTVDPAQAIDAMRLMRAAGALAGERDYMAMATALDQAGLPAEAKAVLEEGVARRHVTAGDSAPRALLASATTRAARERAALNGQVTQARAATGTAAQARATADILLAHGRYAEAAELYNLALTRVGEDPDLLNSRLGIALALAGRRSEAGAALGAAVGPRADVSALWLIWVARRQA